MKKQIEKQIKEQTRPELGFAEIQDVKGFIFKKTPLRTTSPIVWTKWSYKYNRGTYVPIDDETFHNTEKTIVMAQLSPNSNGAIIDGRLGENVNVLYSVAVYVEDDTEATLPIRVARGTNLYLETFYWTNEDDDLYSEEKHRTVIVKSSQSVSYSSDVTLKFTGGEWTIIALYLYRAEDGGFVIAFDDLLKYIQAWRYPDYDAPMPPKWADPPLLTVSNDETEITKNALGWLFPTESDWAGHLVYQVVENRDMAYITPKDVEDDRALSWGGSYDFTGNNGFLLDRVLRKRYNIGTKIKHRNRTLTVRKAITVKGNLIDNGDFGIYNTTSNAFQGWDVHWSTSGIIADVGTVYPSYTDYTIGGNSIVCSTRATDTSYSFYLESTPITKIYTNTDYTFHYYAMGNYDDGNVKVNFYSDSAKTPCSTASTAYVIYSTPTFVQDEIRILSPVSDNVDTSSDIMVPSDCTYMNFELKIADSTTGAIIRQFDGVKFSKDDDYTYTLQTSDATYVEVLENLTVPRNPQTTIYNSLDGSGDILGSLTSYYGTPKLRTHDYFNCFGGGYEVCYPTRNWIVNGDFNTSNGWSNYKSRLIISTSNIYDPVFGSACGVISCNIDNLYSSSYITQTAANDSTAGGSYILSIYAKADTGTSLYLGINNTSDGIVYDNFTLTKSWNRYYLVSSVADASSDKNIYVGVSTGHYGKILVNGAQFEYQTDSTYPRQFNEDYMNGTSLGVLSPQILSIRDTGIGLATTHGTIRFFYTPNFDADTVSTSYYKILFNISENCQAPYPGGPAGLFMCKYEPDLRKFVFRWGYGGLIYLTHSSDAYSTAQSFSAGDRICIHCTWTDDEIQIFTNNIAGDTSDYQPEENTLPGYMGSQGIGVTIGVWGVAMAASTATYYLAYPADGIITDLMVSQSVYNSKKIFIDSQASGVAPDPGPSGGTPSVDNRIASYSYHLLHERKRTDEDIWYTEEEDIDGYEEINVSTVDPDNTSYPVWRESGIPIIIWEHEPVIPNRTYTYAIKCYDSKGNTSEYSKWASIVAGDDISPGPVTSTGSIAGYGTIKWHWTNPDDSDFAKCRIYSGGVSTSDNIIKVVPGDIGVKSEFTQNVTEATSVYVTTLDFNGNEDISEAEKITAAPLSLEEAIEDITVEWDVVSPSDVPKLHFRHDGGSTPTNSYTFGGSDNKFNVTLTSYVELSFDGATYGLSIIDDGGGQVSLSTTAACAYVLDNDDDSQSGNLYSYIWSGVHVNEIKSAQEGDGYIYVKGLSGGSDIEKHFSVKLDKTVPTISRLGINEDPDGDGGSARYITGNFGTVSDAYLYLMATVNTIGTPLSGWGLNGVAQPLLLPDYAKTYNIYGWVLDKALNKSAAYSTSYTYTGVDFSVDITPDRPVDSDVGKEWYSSVIGFTISSEVTPPSYISRVSWTIYWATSDNVVESGSHNDSSSTFGVSEDGTYYIKASATIESGDQAFSDKFYFNVDSTDPVAGGEDPFLNNNSSNYNKGYYFDWAGREFEDAMSGMYEYWFYRKRNSVNPAHPEYDYSLIKKVEADAHSFYDEADILEGWMIYDYRIWAVDKALNTALAAEVEITLRAEWDSTFRNWLDNGSFELTENDTIDEDDCVGWYVDVSNPGHGATAAASLFGQKSALLSTGEWIAQKVMLPTFDYFVDVDTRWVISYWYKGANHFNMYLYLYDYAGNEISGNPQWSITSFDTPTENSEKVDKNNDTWYRKFYTFTPNSWTSAQKTAVYARVVFAPRANHLYIDGVQWEDVDIDPDDPQPTKFRDNRTFTTDRIHVGFIRANMIKVADLHAGLFHAQGVEIKDGVTGAPYLTIGNIDVDSSFIRFTKSGGMRHFPGMSTDNGYAFVSHVESGEGGSFGTDIAFNNRYTNWYGDAVTPKIIIEPKNIMVYDKDHSGTHQYLEVGAVATPGGFTPYSRLSYGSLTEYNQTESEDTDYGTTDDIVLDNAALSDITVKFVIDENTDVEDLVIIGIDYSVYDGSWHFVSTFEEIIATNPFGHTFYHVVANEYEATKIRIDFNYRMGAITIADVLTTNLNYFYGTKTVSQSDMGTFRWTALQSGIN